jgi:hypothetical protein
MQAHLGPKSRTYRAFLLFPPWRLLFRRHDKGSHQLGSRQLFYKPRLIKQPSSETRVQKKSTLMRGLRLGVRMKTKKHRVYIFKANKD